MLLMLDVRPERKQDLETPGKLQISPPVPYRTYLDGFGNRGTRLVAPAGAGPHKVMIAGRSCLAGDVFGQYSLRARLKPGRIVRLGDAAGYTMVKKNWFNGMPMPAIVVRRLNGRLEIVRKFGYKDFVESLS